MAIVAGAAETAYLLVSRPVSPPTPVAGTATPAPLPSVSAPATSGEPAIQPAVDCSGGSPPDAYTGAAITDICDVLVPLAAMDPACTVTPGTTCEAAAVELTQAAEAALTDIRGRHPVTAGEKTADTELRAAFQDYATAGDDLSKGIAKGSSSLEAKGMAALTAGTDALSAAGVDLNG